MRLILVTTPYIELANGYSAKINGNTVNLGISILFGSGKDEQRDQFLYSAIEPGRA